MSTWRKPSGTRGGIGRKQSGMSRLLAYVSARENFVMLLACGYLVFIFLLGGGSRPDIFSFQILRPVSVLVLSVALFTISARQIRDNKFLLLFAVAVTLLVGSHLIPLSPALWSGLPGREATFANDGLIGVPTLWRPLSLDPQLTWNALWALAVPIGFLILMIQLDERGHRAVLTTILGVGVVCVLLSFLQLISDPRGPLYFYRITNFGSPVGLFSNRNHLAVFLSCLLPLLALWVRDATSTRRQAARNEAKVQARRLGASVLVAMILPIILLTGSRAGLVALLVASVLALCVYRFSPRSGKGKRPTDRRRRLLVTIGGIGFVAMVGVAIVLGRGAAFERLVASDVPEARSQLYPLVFDLAKQYSPWGSGIGTFEPVFRMNEPDSFLSPRYANHAHNDLLEVAMTAGIPGLVLILIATIALIGAALRTGLAARRSSLRGSSGRLAIAGLGTIFILAIASVVDYPLRVPSLEALLVISAVWASRKPTIGVAGSRASR